MSDGFVSLIDATNYSWWLIMMSGRKYPSTWTSIKLAFPETKDSPKDDNEKTSDTNDDGADDGENKC